MESIEQEITELWGQITAATYRFLELLAEFDRSGRWGSNGLASCAQWLNIYCGIGQESAREKVRVARALENLPKTRAAFRESRISYSKARAMTRIATPENEHILLDIALHGTAAHVEKTVRYFRKVERIEEVEKAAKAHRHRYIDFRYDDDEHIVVHGRLPVEVGELVRRAIERAMEQLEADRNAPSREDEEAGESQGAVALVDVSAWNAGG